jgi:K+-transporting ATPase ATPase C chain
MESFITSLRLAAISLLICVGGYTIVILGVAQVFAPGTANGSLVMKPDGAIVGSHMLAQAFTQPRYFWPRPSAVGFNAAGAGGSNKSPTSSDLTDRAQKIAAAYGASSARPLPAELAAASGGGLDPHITEHAAAYQVGRIAAARSLPRETIAALVRSHAFAPGWFFTRDRLVNVLELNIALDRQQ